MLPLLLAALAAPSAPPPPKPVLVVMLVVDQLRPDYLDRWRSQLAGGLGRLADGGVFFTHGRQDHAITETAPGHATVLSGRAPYRTGILNNNLGVPDSSAPLVGDATAPGASPSRFHGTALFDWMRHADTATRVLSVSRKDRGAILPVGRGGTDVYWWSKGRFTTSRWYASALPEWVTGWNARGGAARLAGTTWSLLRPESDYAEPDTFAFEHGGSDTRFPHQLPGADAIAEGVTAYPVMDSLTLDFALDGVRQTGLGHRGAPDLLAVSLSTMDAVGHAFGPDSREIHDQVLRLDRWLGAFLDSLDVLVPGAKVIALTADHGVQPMPDYAKATGRDGGTATIGDLAERTGAVLERRYNTRFGLHFDSGLIQADVAMLVAHHVNVDSLAAALAAEVRRQPGLLRAYTPRALAAAPASDVFASRWKRQLAPTTGWLVAAVTKEGYIWAWRGGYATHGTPHEQDVTVPILIDGTGVPARRIARPVRTVDIGPTLAAYLGVRPLEPLDGVVLQEAVPGARH